jgi:hypothetical protein
MKRNLVADDLRDLIQPAARTLAFLRMAQKMQPLAIFAA